MPVYVPLTPESQTMEPEEIAVAGQWVSKLVSIAVNEHKTMELLDMMLSMLSMSYQIISKYS
jgi:hypothetical protein